MSIQKYKQYFGGFQYILLAFFLLLGCYFRFTNLGTKVFWVDEIATAVRVSGYTIAEVTNSLKELDLFEFEDILIYQTINSQKTFIDSWNALVQSPEHTPLFFILTRLWMQLWGSSIVVMRSLAAVLSLLIFPTLYWLCQELFNKPLVGYMAVILMSVSPFYAAYAQEARPYSLWTITILLISASLLRAIRLNNKTSWLLYSISSILGLYTSLFSLYVIFFHGIYILITPIKNKLEILQQYLLFSFISFVAFIPWILVIINNLNLLQENTSWMRGNFNFTEIIAVFIGTVLLIFGDLPISTDSDPVQMAIVLIIAVISSLAMFILSSYIKNKLVKFMALLIISSSILLLSNYVYLDLVSIVGALVALIILSLSSYSLYYLIARSKASHWLFIICLILSLPLPLLIIDIINQGQGSTAPRYLIPLQLGIQIAVAYTLAHKLKFGKRNHFWRFITIGFLILGIFSCHRNLNLSPFYQKGRNINNPAIATIINRSNDPLVLVESADAMDALSLAYSLSSQTKYKLIDLNNDLTKYFNNFSNAFLLKPSIQLRNELQKNNRLNLEQVHKSHLFSADEIPLDLWQVKLQKT